MKRFLILLISSIFFVLNGLAQTKAELDTLAQKTCNCLAGKQLTGTSTDDLKVTLGVCLIEQIQVLGLDVELTEETGMELGKKVGLIMVGKCPNVFASLAKEKIKEKEEAKKSIISGKIKSIEEKEYSTLVVKEESSGKETKLLWIFYFTGSDEFREDPKKLIGKKVKLTYSIQDVYNQKSRDYVTSKIINKLEMVD